MTTLTGHLTQTEKSAIKAIIAAGLTSGKVGRTSYFLALSDGVYTCKKIRNDRGMGWIGNELRQSTYTYTFKL